VRKEKEIRRNKELRKNAKGFILDVGSGHNPLPNASILCDLYPRNSSQRVGPLKTYGKPFVACDARFLPFKDKTFNFIHCSHLLEHVDNITLLFTELKRVGEHGYIESPSWFAENVIYGWKFHKSVVRKKHNNLYYQTVKRLRIKNYQIVPLGFIFHRMWVRSFLWRAIHYILDRYFHIFTVEFHF